MANVTSTRSRIVVGIVALLTALLFSTSLAQTTIRVMRPGYPTEAREFLTRAADAYNEEHPDVNIEIVDADFNTFHDRIMVWISGGQEPDVYMTSITEFPEFVDMQAVLPLDDIVDDELESDIPSAVWDTYRVDGTMYGIPASVTAIGLWYNKDLFEQAGLEPNRPPQTWDEIIEYGMAIEANTDADGIGLNLGRHLDTTQNLAGALLFSGLPGPLVTPQGEPLFNTENGVAALRYMVDLVNVHQVTQDHPEQYTKSDVRLLLRDGKVAMAFDGPWIMGQLGEVTDLSSPETSRFGVAGPPEPSTAGGQAMTSMGADPWVVSANSEHPEVAKDFLRFLVTSEWQYAHDLAVTQTPFRRSIWETHGDDIENAWIYQVLADELENAVVFSPVVPKAGRFLEILNDALQLAVLEMATPEEAFEAAAQEVEALYR